MPTDRTRPSDDRRQGYRGVRYQQGRVILDRDLNAAEELTAEELRDVTRDVVGLVGTPDNGFTITPPSKEVKRPFDFTISAGTYYVGGVRVSFERPATYFKQPDWLHPDWVSDEEEKALLEQEWSEFIGLQIQEVEVSAQEDPDLKDVGLGGPDTAGRLSLLVRVVRLRVDNVQDCKGAFSFAKERWAQQGFQFDEKNNQLVPRGNLKVGFTQAAQTTLCQPQVSGAYLHPNNQNIRIKSVQVKDTLQLLWGFDNASFLYRVDTHTNSRTLKLSMSPPDSTRFPKSEQCVEVLRTTAKLPDGGGIAESEGFVTKLFSGYDSETGTITLADDLPTDMVNSTGPLFVRIWENTIAVPADKASLDAISDPPGPTGLTITVPANPLPLGAYWTFAPRPETPQKVYPERYVGTAQPPDGPRVWVAPLAFLKWDKKGNLRTNLISDCRDPFENLVELTKRKPESGGGCCTITVGPLDLQDTEEFRKRLLERINSVAGCVRVCFRPGVYTLDRPLRLTSEFAGITLEGCCGVFLRADVDPKFEHLDGLIQIIDAPDVTLRHLHIEPLPVPLTPALRERGVEASILKKLDTELPDLHSVVAVRAVRAKNLNLEYCTFQLNIPKETVPGFGAGLMSSHDGTGLKVRDCVFRHDRPVIRQDDPNRRTRIADQLRRIEVAIARYPKDRGQPTHLADLVTSQVITIPEVINPIPGELIPPVDMSRLNDWLDQHAAFRLVNPEGADQPSSRLVAYESVERSGDNIGLLMANKQVQFVSTERARELIEQAGGRLRQVVVNRPFRGLFGTTHVLSELRQKTDNIPRALVSLLDDAEIDRNQFVGLAGAGLAYGATGTIKIRRNDVRDCTAGFWIMASEGPDRPPVRNLALHEIIQSFTPLIMFPLPRAFNLKSDDPMIVDNSSSMPMPGGRYEVLLSDNRVESLATQISETEMILVAAPSPNAVALKSTVILSNNMVHGRSQEAAVVVVTEVERLTITGNVIVNDAPDKGRLSLWITMIKHANDFLADTAVTGNVFVGKSNLAKLPRAFFQPPINTWVPFNSESP
jgi:Family of unknown function (DUF6519)